MRSSAAGSRSWPLLRVIPSTLVFYCSWRSLFCKRSDKAQLPNALSYLSDLLKPYIPSRALSRMQSYKEVCPACPFLRNNLPIWQSLNPDCVFFSRLSRRCGRCIRASCICVVFLLPRSPWFRWGSVVRVLSVFYSAYTGNSTYVFTISVEFCHPAILIVPPAISTSWHLLLRYYSILVDVFLYLA